jgi:hypothetical protein
MNIHKPYIVLRMCPMGNSCTCAPWAIAVCDTACYRRCLVCDVLYMCVERAGLLQIARDV